MNERQINKSHYYETVDTNRVKTSNRSRVIKNLNKEEPEKKLPSKVEMASNLAKSLVKNTKAVLTGDDLVAPPEVKNRRMDLCRACAWFMKDTKRCAKCGCVVPLKAYLAQESCPIEKW